LSIIVSELILAAIFIAEKDLSVVAVEAERVMKKELKFSKIYLQLYDANQ
jgi:hypothetical protein